jgi:hypothetical protein
MRIVSWNIEWMNDWFRGGNEIAFRANNPNRGVTDTDNLCLRVAQVIDDLAPDVLAVQEGPSDIREMELFVQRYLADTAGLPRYKVLGGIDGRSQKIYALLRVDGNFEEAGIAQDAPTRSLEEAWESDIDGDLALEPYEFTRLPLVVEGKPSKSRRPLKVVIVHTKSKYVQDGKRLWSDPTTRPQFVRSAMINRRRISAEAMRCRRLLDDFLDQDASAQIVVTGDFNDGPGTDYFERHYLTHNITDVLLGTVYRPDMMFEHALLNRNASEQTYTVVFDDYVDMIENRPVLLDHILVSPALVHQIQDASVGHEAYEAAVDEKAHEQRQKYPSDHRPVFVDLKSNIARAPTKCGVAQLPECTGECCRDASRADKIE